MGETHNQEPESQDLTDAQRFAVEKSLLKSFPAATEVPPFFWVSLELMEPDERQAEVLVATVESLEKQNRIPRAASVVRFLDSVILAYALKKPIETREQLQAVMDAKSRIARTIKTVVAFNNLYSKTGAVANLN